MRLSTLDRKLLRDLREMVGQVVTIALVVAAGITAFVSLQATWQSLVDSRDAYYAEYRFGDVFVHLERAPASAAERLAETPGVATAYTRIVQPVRLPLPDEPQPPTGQVVSLPPDGDPPLNAIFLQEGRMVEPGRTDEALLLDAFANRRGIVPGDTIPVVMGGVLRNVRVVGLATSPEFVFPMPPTGAALPDEERFAVLWMGRGAVAAAFGMEGGFNDAVLRLAPGASESAVLAAVDRILDPYGGTGAIGRDLQPSNNLLEAELLQLRSFATAIPLIFLGVAAFLVNVVLSRLVILQRGEIAAMKALGYRDREIGRYYLGFVGVVVGLGSVLGLALGAWFGRLITDFYTLFFGLPLLDYGVGWGLTALAVGVSFLFGGVGAMAALGRILRLSPAEAMRPEPPARYRPTLLERTGLGQLTGPSGRMILREVGRHPVRTGLSSLGIAMALAIVVLGTFFTDALDFLIDHQFYRAWREDVTVGLAGPTPERAVRELGALDVVIRAEGMRTTPVRMFSDHRWRDVALQGYEDGSVLRRLLDDEGAVAPMPTGGVVITGALAGILGVSVGDTIRAQLREGRGGVRSLPVTGTVDEMFGLQGHMRLADLNRLLGEGPTVNSIILSVDPHDFPALEARLAELPSVIEVTQRDALVQRFRDQTGEMMWVIVLILSIFASIIAAGVIYNNARVALSLRARDLASLRVLGFTRREVSGILLGELAVQVLLAIPIGMLVGRGMASAIMATVDPEQYRLPVVLNPETYAFAISVVLVAALGTALVVRRRLDHLDLIGVLKTRE